MKLYFKIALFFCVLVVAKANGQTALKESQQIQQRVASYKDYTIRQKIEMHLGSIKSSPLESYVMDFYKKGDKYLVNSEKFVAIYNKDLALMIRHESKEISIYKNSQKDFSLLTQLDFDSLFANATKAEVLTIDNQKRNLIFEFSDHIYKKIIIFYNLKTYDITRIDLYSNEAYPTADNSILVVQFLDIPKEELLNKAQYDITYYIKQKDNNFFPTDRYQKYSIIKN